MPDHATKVMLTDQFPPAERMDVWEILGRAPEGLSERQLMRYVRGALRHRGVDERRRKRLESLWDRQGLCEHPTSREGQSRQWARIMREYFNGPKAGAP
jgi:hypothetical protein